MSGRSAGGNPRSRGAGDEEHSQSSSKTQTTSNIRTLKKARSGKVFNPGASNHDHHGPPQSLSQGVARASHEDQIAGPHSYATAAATRPPPAHDDDDDECDSDEYSYEPAVRVPAPRQARRGKRLSTMMRQRDRELFRSDRRHNFRPDRPSSRSYYSRHDDDDEDPYDDYEEDYEPAYERVQFAPSRRVFPGYDPNPPSRGRHRHQSYDPRDRPTAFVPNETPSSASLSRQPAAAASANIVGNFPQVASKSISRPVFTVRANDPPASDSWDRFREQATRHRRPPEPPYHRRPRSSSSSSSRYHHHHRDRYDRSPSPDDIYSRNSSRYRYGGRYHPGGYDSAEDFDDRPPPPPPRDHRMGRAYRPSSSLSSSRYDRDPRGVRGQPPSPPPPVDDEEDDDDDEEAPPVQPTPRNAAAAAAVPHESIDQLIPSSSENGTVTSMDSKPASINNNSAPQGANGNRKRPPPPQEERNQIANNHTPVPDTGTAKSHEAQEDNTEEEEKKKSGDDDSECPSNVHRYEFGPADGERLNFHCVLSTQEAYDKDVNVAELLMNGYVYTAHAAKRRELLTALRADDVDALGDAAGKLVLLFQGHVRECGDSDFRVRVDIYDYGEIRKEKSQMSMCVGWCEAPVVQKIEEGAVVTITAGPHKGAKGIVKALSTKKDRALLVMPDELKPDTSTCLRWEDIHDVEAIQQGQLLSQISNRSEAHPRQANRDVESFLTGPDVNPDLIAIHPDMNSLFSGVPNRVVPGKTAAHSEASKDFLADLDDHFDPDLYNAMDKLGPSMSPLSTTRYNYLDEKGDRKQPVSAVGGTTERHHKNSATLKAAAAAQQNNGRKRSASAMANKRSSPRDSKGGESVAGSTSTGGSTSVSTQSKPPTNGESKTDPPRKKNQSSVAPTQHRPPPKKRKALPNGGLRQNFSVPATPASSNGIVDVPPITRKRVYVNAPPEDMEEMEEPEVKSIKRGRGRPKRSRDMSSALNFLHSLSLFELKDKMKQLHLPHLGQKTKLFHEICSALMIDQTTPVEALPDEVTGLGQAN